MSPDRCGQPRSAPACAIALLVVVALAGPPACNGDEVGEPTATPTGGAGGSEPVCIGARPPDSAWETSPDGPGPRHPLARAPIPVIGAPPPSWALRDFQPQSCGYGAVYGQSTFVGHVTLVALFSAGCTFCQSQTVGLERMRNELDVNGHDVEFIVLNIPGAQPYQQELVDRCGFPLFQDQANILAMEAYGGETDDMFVYGSDGKLAAYLHNDGTISLSLDDGYAKVRAALLAAR